MYKIELRIPCRGEAVAPDAVDEVKVTPVALSSACSGGRTKHHPGNLGQLWGKGVVGAPEKHPCHILAVCCHVYLWPAPETLLLPIEKVTLMSLVLFENNAFETCNHLCINKSANKDVNRQRRQHDKLDLQT